MFMQCPQRPSGRVESLGPRDGTDGTDGFEPPCGCWQPNWGPLQKQLVTAEPPL